jgi:hypothetical protein
LSDASQFVTGAICVDGGFSIFSVDDLSGLTHTSDLVKMGNFKNLDFE